MKNTTYVPLKNDLLMKLIDRYKENYPLAIDDVIEDFLARTADEHDEQGISGRNPIITQESINHLA